VPNAAATAIVIYVMGAAERPASSKGFGTVLIEQGKHRRLRQPKWRHTDPICDPLFDGASAKLRGRIPVQQNAPNQEIGKNGKI
jgi:hypothetical protein